MITSIPKRNCHAGQAVKNALEMIEIIRLGVTQLVPSPLRGEG